VLWIVPVTYLKFNDLSASVTGYYILPNIPLPPKGAVNILPIEITSPDGTVFNFPKETPLEKIRTTIRSHYGSNANYKRPRFRGNKNFPSEIVQLCKEAQDALDINIFCDSWEEPNSVSVTAPIWSIRFQAAEWIIIPPLALLLLGFGIGWVVRGFRLSV
jgi:hypothetical protein